MTDAPGAAYAFAAAALDRASERREDTAWLDAAWTNAASGLLAVRHDGKVLVDVATMRLVRLGCTTRGVCERRDTSFLGLDGSAPLFSAGLAPGPADELARHNGAKFIDLRSIAAQLPADETAVAAYARALLHWQSRKRYCGRCGAPTRLESAGHRALCTDAGCGQEYFPRTDPAIITVVTDGERCLLGRQAAWPERRYSTLAGFVEPGETLEQAVQREVFEETGVRVGACRYVATQPWPFPASLMIGFEAAATTTAIRTGAELAEARWRSAREMPGAIERGELVLSPKLSIAFHLIDAWFHRLTGAHLEPGPPLMNR
jgi:NAD+ diphosphatase